MTGSADIEALLRTLAPQVVGRLVRRYGDFDSSEDAVQDALLSAAQQWPVDGVPDNPRGWLVTVASRRLIEAVRSDTARRRREATAAQLEPPVGESAPVEDDTLTLLLLCCHPALTLPSQVALTLRAVGGLTTAEIARALLVPESTVGQRISRAKQRIRTTGAEFGLPPQEHRSQRVTAVLKVLYLIFNEGYAASSGPALLRVELTAEAIRLTRKLHTMLPDDGEVAGLLALMLLTDARRLARTRPDGALVPLAEQDRGRWDRQAISEGTELVTRTLTAGPVGPYQLQAAIAAVHTDAEHAEDTDWPQILSLYNLLRTAAPGPMITLNRIVAIAMVHDAQTALHELTTASTDDALTRHHRAHAVRAHLLELVGDLPAARDAYLTAAHRTSNIPEQRYLTSRTAVLCGRFLTAQCHLVGRSPAPGSPAAR